MAATWCFQIVSALAMLHGFIADESRDLLVVAYNTTVEPNPCATQGAVPTPAPESPCGTAAPVYFTLTTTPGIASPTVYTTVTTTPGTTVMPIVYTTVTTTPGTTVTTTPANTYAPAPAGPCGTVVPEATYTTTPGATDTTTPSATYTSTPAATHTTSPAGTSTSTPAQGTHIPAPASPCGTVAPVAKFAAEQVMETETRNSVLFQKSSIPIGLFSFMFALAVVGMIVRSYRRYTSPTTNFRRVSGVEDAYHSVAASDIESNQQLFK